MKDEEDARLDELLPQGTCKMVEDSLQEYAILDTRKEAMTAWAEPAHTRCAIVWMLESGLTEYPNIP